MNSFSTPPKDLSLRNFFSNNASIPTLTSAKIDTSLLISKKLTSKDITASNIRTKKLFVNGVNVPFTPSEYSCFGTASGTDSLTNLIAAPSQLRVGTNALKEMGSGTEGLANVAIGKDALTSLTDVSTASSNIAIGYRSLFSQTDGDSNVMIGTNSGHSITTGTENVGIGNDALLTETKGDGNVAIGTTALSQGSDNTSCIAIGFGSATNASHGSDFIAIGSSALNSLSDPSNGSIAIGSSALTAQTTAVSNVAVGKQAGTHVTIGSSNVIIGTESAPTVTTASSCVLIGAQVAHSASVNLGDDNVAVGNLSLESAGALANQCVAVGSQAAGHANATGVVAVGYQALNGLTTSPGNTAVGVQALLTLTNDITGLNTAVGAYCLSNATGYFNTSVGGYSMTATGTGSGNVAIGATAGESIDTGNFNIIIGSQTDVDDGARTNTIIIGQGITTSASNQITIGTADHTQCIVRGISGQISTGGVPVVINASGVLGTLTMFEEKEDIHDERRISDDLIESLYPRMMSVKNGSIKLGLSGRSAYPEIQTEQDVIVLLLDQVLKLKDDVKWLRSKVQQV